MLLYNLKKLSEAAEQDLGESKDGTSEIKELPQLKMYLLLFQLPHSEQLACSLQGQIVTKKQKHQSIVPESHAHSNPLVCAWKCLSMLQNYLDGT